MVAPRVRVCPYCRRQVSMRKNGTLYRHRYYDHVLNLMPIGLVCGGSGHTLITAQDRYNEATKPIFTETAT